ncbi:hypothetical protein GCM10009555_099380 [Acrocarpospora macrocephala]|uniref:Uncharacterized protein n=1 Tax=Acrocarpospora macrocephala TaxID=150177 RepID=A0A5M3X8D7_9ACTN|nr:hypothetical protein Amac_087600 [Acrocarpospora macrocephala]
MRLRQIDLVHTHTGGNRSDLPFRRRAEVLICRQCVASPEPRLCVAAPGTSWAALAIPGLFSAFGTFLMRQAFRVGVEGWIGDWAESWGPVVRWVMGRELAGGWDGSRIGAEGWAN